MTGDVRALAATWRSRVDVVAANLSELVSSQDARTVRARSGAGPGAYAGRTLVAAVEACAAMDGLWGDYLLLSGVIDEAVALARRPAGWLGGRDDATVERLINGPSIHLPPTTVPLMSRGLLDGAEHERATTPTEVLEGMGAAFARVRDAVSAIVRSEAAADALAEMRRDARDDPSPEVRAILARAQAAATDPLAAEDLLRVLGAAVEASRRGRREAAERQHALVRDLSAAHREVAALGDARSACVEGVRGAIRVVNVDARNLPGAGRAGELEAALRDVAARAAGGDVEGARRDLDGVRAAAARDAGVVALVAAEVEARLAEVVSLAGRVLALGAKEAALRARGHLQEGCGRLGDAARDEVARAPRRVDDLRRAVEAYEAALSGRAPRVADDRGGQA